MVEWHVRMVSRQQRRALPSCRSDSSAGLPDAVRRLRRGLRDVRDRMARRQRRWREVCFAGMAGGDGTALVMITHEGVDRHEVEDVLRRRWPDVVVKSLEQEEPAVAMTAGRCCRSRTVPPRCRAAADRDHAPAGSADRLACHRADARGRLIGIRPGNRDGITQHSRSRPPKVAVRQRIYRSKLNQGCCPAADNPQSFQRVDPSVAAAATATRFGLSAQADASFDAGGGGCHGIASRPLECPYSRLVPSALMDRPGEDHRPAWLVLPPGDRYCPRPLAVPPAIRADLAPGLHLRGLYWRGAGRRIRTDAALGCTSSDPCWRGAGRRIRTDAAFWLHLRRCWRGAGRRIRADAAPGLLRGRTGGALAGGSVLTSPLGCTSAVVLARRRPEDPC